MPSKKAEESRGGGDESEVTHYEFQPEEPTEKNELFVPEKGDGNKKNGEEITKIEDTKEENSSVKKEQDENQDSKIQGHKRKKSTAPTSPNKATKSSSDQIHPTPTQLLKFLLSDAALDICRPGDEADALESNSSSNTTTSTTKDLRTYSEPLTPFEELLSAVILSRPISHRLGRRTIRTILNPPYSFTSPAAIKEAGSEKIHQALFDARTQHKGKTAEEIELIADAVRGNEWGSDLDRLREKCRLEVGEEREELRKSVKGLGPTGLDIFYRRVQGVWEEAFPFVDARTRGSVEKLGLPGEAGELRVLVEKEWEGLGMGAKEGQGEGEDEERDEAEMMRKAFVLLLERAVGADLEGQSEKVIEAAREV